MLAARSLGVRSRDITMSHVLPNSVGPVIVQATLILATVIIDVAALSFLGLGSADPNVAEWGRMLVNAQRELEVAPAWRSIPGIAIAVVALGLHAAGGVAARGPRPQEPQAMSTGGEHRSRSSRSTTCGSPSPASTAATSSPSTG